MIDWDNNILAEHLLAWTFVFNFIVIRAYQKSGWDEDEFPDIISIYVVFL